MGVCRSVLGAAERAWSCATPVGGLPSRTVGGAVDDGALVAEVGLHLCRNAKATLEGAPCVDPDVSSARGDLGSGGAPKADDVGAASDRIRTGRACARSLGEHRPYFASALLDLELAAARAARPWLFVRCRGRRGAGGRDPSFERSLGDLQASDLRARERVNVDLLRLEAKPTARMLDDRHVVASRHDGALASDADTVGLRAKHRHLTTARLERRRQRRAGDAPGRSEAPAFAAHLVVSVLGQRLVLIAKLRK